MKTCDGMSLRHADRQALRGRFGRQRDPGGQPRRHGRDLEPRTATSPTSDKGQLDQPCEALVRGNTIVVSNMDWPFPGMRNTKHKMPAVISVVKIPGK